MSTQPTTIIEEIKKEFREKFVCDPDPKEHAFVGLYSEDDNKFEFWNAYRIERFLEEKFTLAYNKGKQDVWEEMAKSSKKVV